METLNISKLSAADKAALMAALSAEQKAEKNKKLADREALKILQNEFCSKWLTPLAEFGKAQTEIVDAVFADTSPLLDLKIALYELREAQDSHTFTARDGSGSIAIGYNTIIGFDGTGNAGVQKVKDYLASLSEDDVNYVKIKKILNVLMKPDKNGNLNPTRVTELANLKADIDNELFSDGIEIIINAQFKTRTSSYVSGWMRKVSETGKEVKVNFRITAQ